MSDCRRKPGLVDRVVGGRITDDDRRHAPTCSWCGPVLTRANTFDEELRRVARSLVAEELPRGILDQEPGGRATGVVARRAAPGFAAILAAAAILLVTTVIALAPGAAPSASPPPGSPAPSSSNPPSSTPSVKPFVERMNTTAFIVGKLTASGYHCNDGAALESPGPGPDPVTRESAVCTSPEKAGPFTLAVIVGEAANGKVVEVSIKADLIADSPENRALLAVEVSKVLVVSTLDEQTGQNGGLWVKAHLPELNVGDQIDYGINGMSFHAERLPNQSYLIVAQGAGLT